MTAEATWLDEATRTVGAFDAKTHLSEILARAESGETFTITKRGRPVAMIIPVVGAHADRLALWERVDRRRESLRQAGRTVTRVEIRKAIDEGRM